MIGYRTYIIAILVAVVAGAEFLGWIDSGIANTLKTFLVGGGLWTLRNAIERLA